MKVSFEIAGLTRSYPGFQLGPVSLTLEPGKSYGLVGPNGAAKTTLLNCLSLQTRPSGGTVSYGTEKMEWEGLEMEEAGDAGS
jgi:ABC-type multidrug transport system ATPase subunit